MIGLYHTLISTPFYNGFIFLMDKLPFFDAGVVVVIFTIVVKLILLPLSIKASKAQLQMKGTERDLQIIKEKYKDKEEQAKKTMEYYKDNGINPFAGFIILLVQLPILIGLYGVFLKSGLPQVDMTLLYSFVGIPEKINMVFLGFVDISQKSIFLAIIAGITTYFQISLANATTAPASEGGTQNEIAKVMAMQMKYFFPILMAFIAYTISSAVALYLITSNIFAVGQEFYIRKKYHKSTLVV